eukprot:260637-Amphidinium_carterae.1
MCHFCYPSCTRSLSNPTIGQFPSLNCGCHPEFLNWLMKNLTQLYCPFNLGFARSLETFGWHLSTWTLWPSSQGVGLLKRWGLPAWVRIPLVSICPSYPDFDPTKTHQSHL